MLKRDPNDPNAPSTYLDHARAAQALDEPGGRFAKPTVVGTTPIPAYPKAAQPMNADSASEPPLGDDLAPEPVGTPAEIAASIAPQLKRRSLR